MVENKVKRIIINFLILPLFSFIILFPILWMLVMAIKQPHDTYTIPVKYIPSDPTIANFVNMWGELNFKRFFLNTLIVAGSTTIISIILAAPAAYGFSRFKFKGSFFSGMFLLSTQMFPRVLLIVPYFILMRSLNLINTYPALILIYVSFALPFCIWMLRGFFESIPSEIDESALIDGCSPFQAFKYVVLPLAIPGVVATSIYSFLVGWNEFLFALCLTTNKSMYVITVGLASLIGEYRTLWNELMAAAIIASIPAIVLYAYLERYLVEGLTAGATKG